MNIVNKYKPYITNIETKIDNFFEKHGVSTFNCFANLFLIGIFMFGVITEISYISNMSKYKNIEKVYSSEFIESSVKLALESKNTINQTSYDLRIETSILNTWIIKKLHAELEILKKENYQLMQELDIFKKTGNTNPK